MAKYTISARELDVLQHARLAMGLTNEEVGKAIGKSESQASRLFNGAQETIQLHVLHKLLAALQIQPDKFFIQTELPLEIAGALIQFAEQSLRDQIISLDRDMIGIEHALRLQTVIGLRVSASDSSTKSVERTVLLNVRIAGGKRILEVA